VTVIALVLGLTVVALQLSSTQFSPRLLGNFLRDRPTQVVLSGFIATFVSSAAGLFTVGVEAGERTEDYPRLAVSGAIALLFLSLGMVVYFADHLVHSIQIDAINRRVERNTRHAIAQEDTATVEEAAPQVPEWAVPLRGRRSGYIQTVYPLLLLPLVSDGDVTICLRKRVGEHVVEGTVIGWIWAPSPADPPPAAEPFEAALDADVRIGFERTIEQDIAFGIRQQIDIGCKALSAAINDPYTAVQAIDHLAVVSSDLAVRPFGTKIITGPGRQWARRHTSEQLRRLHLLHRRAIWTLWLERSHCDVGAASLVRDRCRGTSPRLGPLAGDGSGSRRGTCRRRTLNAAST
jgi:uncharacterized membrane protein